MSGRRNFQGAFGLGAIFGKLYDKLSTMRLDSAQGLKLLMVMGGLSLFFLAVPGIHVFLLFSVIGIPLIPAAIVFPPLVLVWFCVLAFRLILPIRGRLGTLVAFVATALLLFLPAQWLNNAAYLKIAEFTLDDRTPVEGPLRSDTLAVVNRMNGKGGACGPLCLHALLSGTASTVIASYVPVGTSLPDPTEIATAYFFERHPICPSIDLKPKNYVLSAQGVPSVNGYVGKPQPNAAEIASQRIASGLCLMSRKARIYEADAMVMIGPVVKEPERNTSFLFRLQGMNVSQLNVFERNETGTFREVLRKSSGSYVRFAPLLLPMASPTLHEPSGWLRLTRRLNDKDYGSQRKGDVFAKLEETFGIDLSLHAGDYRKAAQEGMIAALDRGHGPTEAEWRAFSLYWENLEFSIGAGGRVAPDAVDAEIALRILQSPTVPMPKFFGRFVRYAVKTNLVAADSLADGLAKRLRADGNEKDILLAAEGMSSLPDDVLRGRLDVLEELARAPEKRPHVTKLLSKLHLGGPEFAPLLRDLVETGIERDDLDLARQALLGLCEIGPAARPALEQLDEARMSLNKSDRRLYYKTRIVVSVHLGLERETLWRLVPPEVRMLSDAEWFDKLYNGAPVRRSPCHT